MLAIVSLALTACRGLPRADGPSLPPSSRPSPEAVAPTIRGLWEQLPPLSTARQELGAVAEGGHIYALGGLPGSTAGGTAEAFDLLPRSWRPISGPPLPVHHPGVAGLEGLVYLFGGYLGDSFAPTDAAFVYEPQNDQWRPLAKLPQKLGANTGLALGGSLFSIGGAAASSLGSLYRYNPSEDQWIELAPMPTPRNHLAAAAIEGRIYAVGGRNEASFTLNVLERYDPATNTWETLSPMPTGRSGHAAAAVQGYLLVFGGEGNTGTRDGMFDQVELYDPRSDHWSRLDPMPTPRHGFYGAAAGDSIYLPGGATVQGVGAVPHFDRFTLAVTPAP